MVRIENNKIRWFISSMISVLILFGTFHSIFSVIAFGCSVLFLLFCDRESVLMQMFFIMPMANIFKVSPSSQSFFTILLLLYVLLYFVLPRKATILIVLFTVYVVIGQLFSGSFMLFRTIKLIFNVLFLSSTLNCKVQFNHKNIFFSYILGNVIASSFAFLDSSFFRINSYIGEKGIGGLEFIDLTRFKGLYGDPNYYTIGMIVCLCLLLVLYYRNELRLAALFLWTVPIVYFLIMTYSKSALLMLAFVLVYLFYILLKKKRYALFACVLMGVGIVLILTFSGKIEALNVILSRLNASDFADNADINSITTGRFDLWKSYFKYMVKDPIIMLFGEGISASLVNGRAAHNSYFDMWYFLGAVGTVLLITLLTVILTQSKKNSLKKNPVNYCVLFSILILYFFLSELFYFDPPFHIFLAFVVLNLPMDTTVRENKLV